ncbi:peptide deformylase [Bifidobacterium psychraerophilum]|uniref:peptide deformylase n=1 Tax=Bifidobacterium psychraerophilum TaxID=218140 RepID=UPI00310FF80D
MAMRTRSTLDREVEQLLHDAGRNHLLPIVQMGEAVLRQPTEALQGQLSRRTLHRLIEAMRATMLEAPGVGLAGPQIGLGLAIAVVEDHVRDDCDEDDAEAESDEYEDEGEDAPDDAGEDPREIAEFPFHEIINPTYEPIGTQTRSFYEGCLSFDGYQAVRRRWLDITARWQDAQGKQHEEHLHGWPARIFQHETDHLSGEIYIDKAEIRSLTSNENLEELWAYDPVPRDAAKELGFTL